MPRQSQFRIELSRDEHASLQKRAGAHTAPYWEVVRARIVLLAAEGPSNKEIAARLDTTPQTACKWRKRFYEEGLGGLLIAFQKRNEQATEPFAWQFIRHDLDRLFSRLAEHDPLASSSVAAA